MPQGTATTDDCPFPAKSSAVMRDQGQSGECGSFFAGDGADLRHFGDQHCACNRAYPWDGTQNGGHLRQVIIARDGPGEAVARQPTKPDGLSCKPIDIATGRVTPGRWHHQF